MKNLNDDLKLHKHVTVIADKDLAIRQFLKANPMYDYEANVRVITTYLGDAQATQANLVFALDSLSHVHALAIKTEEQVEEEQAERLQQQIENDRANADREVARLKSMSSFEIKQELKRLRGN